MAEGLIEITDLHVLMTGEDIDMIEVTSPECSFDRAANSGSSSAPLLAVGTNMRLRGVGYQFLLDQQKLLLFEQVRMTIGNEGATLFPLADNKENQD